MQTDEFTKYFQYSFIPALESADSAFAQIETNESIELSSSLTGSSDTFTVDHTDIYVLRTTPSRRTYRSQAGYDWNFKMGEMEALEEMMTRRERVWSD